jgi:RNA polymerase sigma-70 factor (ECF subfamily)
MLFIGVHSWEVRMEEEIVLRAQGGDTDAFRMLVERYGPNAWRVARILLPQREQAEDALQEAWVDIWRGLPHFDVSRPLYPWLLTIVGNRCRMYRRRVSEPTQSLVPALAESLPDHHDAIAEVAARESNAALRVALTALTPEERELLILRYQADLQLAEIAALYEIPLSTVKSRLYRTLAALRDRLTTIASETPA